MRDRIEELIIDREVNSVRLSSLLLYSTSRRMYVLSVKLVETQAFCRISQWRSQQWSLDLWSTPRPSAPPAVSAALAFRPRRDRKVARCVLHRSMDTGVLLLHCDPKHCTHHPAKADRGCARLRMSPARAIHLLRSFEPNEPKRWWWWWWSPDVYLMVRSFDLSIGTFFLTGQEGAKEHLK